MNSPRRVLVAVMEVEVGGSQLNALDLAAANRDLGDDVRLFAARRPGPAPLVDLAHDRGVPVTMVDVPQRPRERDVARQLMRTVSQHGSEVVHAYEFDTAMAGLSGAFLRRGTPLVMTVMGMSVPRWLPASADLIVGTEQLRRQTSERRSGPVHLMEPPVNTLLDDPSVVDETAFRRRHSIAPDAPLVVVVSRLVEEMKREGIDLVIDAFSYLNIPGAVFAVVGDGPARSALEQHASSVNTFLGRRAVIFTGEALDPREAYAGADVVVGMGGSALRAMAFAKPLLVVGEKGFWLPCTPETADTFLDQGFFGHAQGSADPDAVAALLRSWIADQSERDRLGKFGVELVRQRFSLVSAATHLQTVYDTAARRRRSLPSRSLEVARAVAHRYAADRLDESTRRRLRSFVSQSTGRTNGT